MCGHRRMEGFAAADSAPGTIDVRGLSTIARGEFASGVHFDGRQRRRLDRGHSPLRCLCADIRLGLWSTTEPKRVVAKGACGVRSASGSLVLGARGGTSRPTAPHGVYRRIDATPSDGTPVVQHGRALLLRMNTRNSL
jgi:hypothetical protein